MAYDERDPSEIQEAATYFSQVPYFELKVPPPNCCAYSQITVRAQASHVLAMSLSDIGCDRLLSNMLNLAIALDERSSLSLLFKKEPHHVTLSSEDDPVSYRDVFLETRADFGLW